MDPASVLLVRGVVGIVAGILAMFWPGITITFLVVLFGAYAFIDGVTNVAIAMRRSPDGTRSWSTLLQGLVGVAAGVLVFIWPGPATLALLLLIAVWATVTGALEIVAAVRLRREIKGEWLLALSGTLSIVFGVFLILFPALGAIALAWALGAYTAASGAILAALAIRLRTAHPLAA